MIMLLIFSTKIVQLNNAPIRKLSISGHGFFLCYFNKPTTTTTPPPKKKDIPSFYSALAPGL